MRNSLKRLNLASISHYLEEENALLALTRACLMNKQRWVSEDLYDRKGQRIMLNFGHTLAHALERLTHCSHGQAVSRGMAFSSWFSMREKLLLSHTHERIINLLKRYDLGVDLPGISEELVACMAADKKQGIDGLSEILPTRHWRSCAETPRHGYTP